MRPFGVDIDPLSMDAIPIQTYGITISPTYTFCCWRWILYNFRNFDPLLAYSPENKPCPLRNSGCRRQAFAESLQELKIEAEEVWVPPTELDIDVPCLFQQVFLFGNAWWLVKLAMIMNGVIHVGWWSCLILKWGYLSLKRCLLEWEHGPFCLGACGPGGDFQFGIPKLRVFWTNIFQVHWSVQKGEESWINISPNDHPKRMTLFFKSPFSPSKSWGFLHWSWPFFLKDISMTPSSPFSPTPRTPKNPSIFQWPFWSWGFQRSTPTASGVVSHFFSG